MAGGQGAVTLKIGYRGPFRTEWQAVEEKWQAKILVFQKLKAQFPKVHTRIGNGGGLLVLIAEQHHAKIAANRSVTIAISVKQHLEVMLALHQGRQKTGNGGIDLIRNELPDAFLTRSSGFSVRVMQSQTD